MSRTFRRKGYEAKQGSIQGGKVAGYYTIKEGGWWRWNKKPVLFREPTRQEYYEQFWKLHGDSHRNQWSPGRSYREGRQVENQSINKQELCKWLKDADYEPVFEANPRSCLWDWS